MKENKPKTKKVKKRRLKIKGVFLLAAILASIILLGKLLFKINVRSVSVTGNNLIKDSEIIKDLGLNKKTKFLTLNTQKTCNTLKNNSLIESCTIKKSINFKLQVIIKENIPLFYYTQNSKVILSDGSEIENTHSYSIPTLINYVPDKIMDEFIAGLSNIDDDIIHSISEIEYTPSANEDGTYIDEERFMLMMNDGNTVYINNKNINILNYYKKIYASIGDKKGIYNFDCDYDNYLFKEYGDKDELPTKNGKTD